VSEAVAIGAYDRLLDAVRRFLQKLREPRQLVFDERWEEVWPGVPATLHERRSFRYSLKLAAVLLKGDDWKAFTADLCGNYQRIVNVYNERYAAVWLVSRPLVWCGDALATMLGVVVGVLTYLLGGFFLWLFGRLVAAAVRLVTG
jgi:hypothetical protein